MAGWVSTDRLGLDVHHVITVDAKHGTPMHKTIDKDVFIFIVLYKLTYGLNQLYICSRINSPSLEVIDEYGGNSKHYVLRCLEDIGLLDMGLPRNNIDSCTTFEEKGMFAQFHNLRCFVDDRFECLAGIHHHSPDTELIQYTNDPYHQGRFRARHSCRNDPDFSEISDKIWVMSRWRELAHWCGLPTGDDIWAWLGQRVPPLHAYDSEVPDLCRALLHITSPLAVQRPRLQLVPKSKAKPKVKASPKVKAKARPSGRPVVAGTATVGSPRQPSSMPPGFSARPSIAPGNVNDPQPSNPYVPAAGDVTLPFPPTPPPSLPSQTMPTAQEALVTHAISAMLSYGGGVQMNISHEGAVSLSTEGQGSSSSHGIPPTVTRWSTSQGTKWHECKRIRAEKYRAAQQAHLATGVPDPVPHLHASLLMCVICHTSQRALRCDRECCVHCCVANYEACASYEHGISRF